MITMAAFLAVWMILLFTVDFTAVQSVALAAAAVLSIPITQIIKKATGVNGGLALIVAGIIAAGLTVLAMFASGQARTFQDVLLNVAGVFGVAQVIFRGLVYADRAFPLADD